VMKSPSPLMPSLPVLKVTMVIDISISKILIMNYMLI
jgi:hypothetical protein